jgi:hypothetical protein
LISAGGAIGSSLIGAHAANKAGDLLYAKGSQVGQSLDKATGGAIAAGYEGLKESNAALDTGLSNTYKEVDQGVSAANNTLSDVYGQQLNELSPYTDAGKTGVSTLASLVAPGGDLSEPFTADMMAKYDPGFGFRLAEGEKALQASAAARGAAQGGGAAKAMARFGQGLASSEYGAAFDRYMTGQKFRYDTLAGLAGLGLNATSTAVNAGTNFGDRTSLNFMTGAGTKADATLRTGLTKSGTAMQGNQWIGNIGLEGANLAGNAYMGGALGKASGDMAAGSAYANGVAGAGNTLSGLLMANYWHQQNQPPLNLPIDNTVSAPITTQPIPPVTPVGGGW